ncbi:YqaJ viral recombinase family protein [Bradyrhizobium sp. 2]|uniref:YqaJ viral recombinase family protein n=1 Tax=Bradyrhizobium sp. 2 TaxID=190045 RepID=UPI001FF91E64|nr:YqaJ viral recombinase family protein [Bradyrhizobium sp. 2]
MQAGTETEPEARDAYSFYTGQTVRQVGLIRHRSIEQSHASPDGLIGDDGMLEIAPSACGTHGNATHAEDPGEVRHANDVADGM